MNQYIGKVVTVSVQQRKIHIPQSAAKKARTELIPPKKYTFKVSSVIESEGVIIFNDTEGDEFTFYRDEITIKVHSPTRLLPRMRASSRV